MVGHRLQEAVFQTAEDAQCIGPAGVPIHLVALLQPQTGRAVGGDERADAVLLLQGHGGLAGGAGHLRAGKAQIFIRVAYVAAEQGQQIGEERYDGAGNLTQSTVQE